MTKRGTPAGTPITLGLTGSIGMGKSTVAAMFADLGVPVFDADAAVHHLQGPAGRVVAAIEAAFPSTTGPDGVNRTALAEAVLGDDAAMKRLEAIVHPAVGEERAAFLATHADAPLLVFDVPLLFETGGDARVDKVAVVSAAPDVQRARVLTRPGMTPAKFDAILARQLPDAAKRARADFVIPTDVTLAETRAAVAHVVAHLAACLTPPTSG
jgi:dephospho-CoA kinase